MMSFGLRVAVLGMCTALVSLPPAEAQKYPGDTLQSPPAYTPPPPVSPLPMPRAAPAPLPQPQPRPAPPFAPPPPPAAAITPEGDAQARQLANQLPLDPATRDLRKPPAARRARHNPPARAACAERHAGRSAQPASLEHGDRQ